MIFRYESSDIIRAKTEDTPKGIGKYLSRYNTHIQQIYVDQTTWGGIIAIRCQDYKGYYIGTKVFKNEYDMFYFLFKIPGIEAFRNKIVFGK